LDGPVEACKVEALLGVFSFMQDQFPFLWFAIVELYITKFLNNIPHARKSVLQKRKYASKSLHFASLHRAIQVDKVDFFVEDYYSSGKNGP
jgi:hypothetical protein